MRLLVASVLPLLTPPPYQDAARAPIERIRAAVSGPPPPPPLIDPAEFLRAGPDTLKRLLSPEAFELQKELAELAVQQDPRVVVRRSLDLARALQVVGTEAAETVVSGSGLSEQSVPVLLRRLCEELGATYVKLGQFIASSPTLFPPECAHSHPRCLQPLPEP